ncbi:DHHC zinc finger domain containing protein [Babesia divergens]|uniref:Palmitoyltransferase n=1 Tax=Babesia divergens TaxID=32595 RepID=A0AAD9GHS8_BABDI|nr:DHHC zinc finger domain containing protein [Babesia divergens]
MSDDAEDPKNDDSEEQGTGNRRNTQTASDTLRRIVNCVSKDERIVVALSMVLLYTPLILFATTLEWYIKFIGSTPPTVFLVVATIALACFHIASISDAGVIPKQNDIYDAYDAVRMKRKHNNIPPCIEVAIAGKFLRIKYCHTCNIYRPPRSVHCSVCDVCVHKFDHHCKWLGNCVGGHNYKAFYGFISFTFIEITLLIVLSIIRIIVILRDHPEGAKVAQSVGIILYILISGWFIIGLLVYHTYLICTNKTTNEQLKALYAEYNPWNRGILRNLKEALLTPRRTGRLRHPSDKPKMLYDPGRSVPPYYNPAYGDIAVTKDRRFAFDSTTNELWENMHYIVEENDAAATFNSYLLRVHDLPGNSNGSKIINDTSGQVQMITDALDHDRAL